MVSVQERKRKNHITLYLDINHDGTRIHEPLGLKLIGDPEIDKQTRATAEAIAAKRNLEIAEGKYDIHIARNERSFLD